MDINLKITIEETPALLTTLNTLCEVLKAFNSAPKEAPVAAKVAKPPKAKAEPVTVTEQAQAMMTEERVQKNEIAPAAEPAAAVTKEQLIGALGNFLKADAGNKAKLAGALKECGGAKVSDLKAEDYGKLLGLLGLVV